MRKIIKAILKVIYILAIYFIVSLVINFIITSTPYAKHILLIIAILGMILMFYFMDKE